MAEATFKGNPIEVRKAARKMTKTFEALSLTRDESLYCVKLNRQVYQGRIRNIHS